MKIYKYAAKDRPTYVQDGGYLCIDGEVIGFGTEEANTEITVDEAMSRGDAITAAIILERLGFDISTSTKAWLVGRKRAYASIEDQLDMMYHDAVNGTTWRAHVNKVKADNPKPVTEIS